MHTLSRELQKTAMLSYLLGDMVYHAVNVGGDKFLLETFQLVLSTQTHKVIHPLLPLIMWYSYIDHTATKQLSVTFV